MNSEAMNLWQKANSESLVTNSNNAHNVLKPIVPNVTTVPNAPTSYNFNNLKLQVNSDLVNSDLALLAPILTAILKGYTVINILA